MVILRWLNPFATFIIDPFSVWKWTMRFSDSLNNLFSSWELSFCNSFTAEINSLACLQSQIYMSPHPCIKNPMYRDQEKNIEESKFRALTCDALLEASSIAFLIFHNLLGSRQTKVWVDKMGKRTINSYDKYNRKFIANVHKIFKVIKLKRCRRQINTQYCYTWLDKASPRWMSQWQ